MANDFFKFKKFTIRQGKAGMKVCTDACLFGAYVTIIPDDHVLDIGTGTGLLSLMLAQRFQCEIDAVEIDESSFQHAKENVLASPWNNRINVYHSSIQDYIKKCQLKYSTIISNPPFYKDSKKSRHENRNLAMHTSQLSYEDLIFIIKKSLKSDGIAYVMYPEYEANEFALSCKIAGLIIVNSCIIRDRADKEVLRKIVIVKRSLVKKASEEEIIIKKEDGTYSETFTKLLSAFYLKL